MMIHLTLFGPYREKLPKEARGKIDLELPPETTLADVLAQFGIDSAGLCSVNGAITRDFSLTLQDGDRLYIFRAAGGG